ncbi:MAG TPA: hypothetical protein VGE52_05445 [Pirellulales bacterium]
MSSSTPRNAPRRDRYPAPSPRPTLARTVLAWLVLPAVAWALSSSEWQTRAARIEQLDPAAKDQLRRKWEWFQTHRDAQPALLKLNEQLEQSADGERLRRIANSYYDWFSKLRPGQQRELSELPAAERIERVAEWRQKEIERDRVAHLLSNDDIKAIFAWMREIGRNRFDGPGGNGPGGNGRGPGGDGNGSGLFGGRGGGPGGFDGGAARFWFDDKVSPRENLARLAGGFRFGGHARVFENVKSDDATRLLDSLTPATREKLAATRKTPGEQLALLRDWVRTTSEVEFWKSWKPADPDALWQFFSKLSREEQVALEGLSAGDMLQQVQRMFYERNNPRRGGRDGFGGPPSDGDRPPMGRPSFGEGSGESPRGGRLRSGASEPPAANAPPPAP